MLKTFLRWFQAPRFLDDEDRTRSALLLNVVLNTFLIALPVIIIGTLLGGNVPRMWNASLSSSHSPGLQSLERVYYAYGASRAAGSLTVVILFVATTLAVYNLGTIRAPATSFYLLTIVMSGLVISRRAIIWMAGLSTARLNLLLLAERNGWLPEPTLTVSIAQGVTFTVTFTIISILLYLAIRSIDEALTRVRQELTERQRTEEKLRSSEERFRAMIENISDAIALVDNQAIIHYITPAAERILGYSSAERIGFTSFRQPRTRMRMPHFTTYSRKAAGRTKRKAVLCTPGTSQGWISALDRGHSRKSAGLAKCAGHCRELS